jgi:putative restriction endonuclease
MRGYVGVTDYDWYDFLRSQPDLDEVNFWRPSGKGLALPSGTPFLFKLKAKHNNVIAGFGFFARASIIPASLAWDAFTVRNGAPTEAAMRVRIEKYREAPPSAHGDYDIGCLMISQPVFFEPGELRDPLISKRSQRLRNWGPRQFQCRGLGA